jgi:hypothetical protein
MNATDDRVARQNRHLRRIGAVSLVVIGIVFVVGVFAQRAKERDERQILRAADAEMAAGVLFDCAAFARAHTLYYEAMRNHLQSKTLVGKTSISRELAALCTADLPTVLAARQKVIAAGAIGFDEVRALALAQLAARQRPEALATLELLPDDEFCRWLAAWIRALPGMR